MKPYLIRSLLAVALVAGSVPAWADVGRDEAAAAAQRVVAGRVLAVDRAQDGARAVWRVKIVTPAGDVRVVIVDVATGRAH